jgi:general secretion pathway protein E
MNKLNTLKIDYNLIVKYQKDYLLLNKILPYYEDEICIKVLVSKKSNLTSIEKKITKLIKYTEVEEKDLLFYLAHMDIKIELFNLVEKSLSLNFNDDSYMDDFLSKVLFFAVSSRASDIHIERYKDLTQFRFRIDGRLKIFFSFKIDFFMPLSSYIKLISNLDITQNRMLLNSRFSKKINDCTYDFRVSTMPTISNESIVIRILDKKVINKSIFELGLSNDLVLKLKDSINLKQGLVLITGPTGSGKTTTLYSIIKELKCEEKKIITIEDPIEYRVDDINQVPINDKIGLDYELVLKNILRQDPIKVLVSFKSFTNWTFSIS